MLAPVSVMKGHEDDPVTTLIREGDHRSAIAQMSRDHGASVGRLCFVLLRSQVEAEEVAQETFLAAHKALAQYRGQGSLRSWLFGIARRQCARRLERGKRSHLELIEESIAGSEDPELSARKTRRAVQLRAALATLKPSERDAVVLRYSSELDFREVAAAMDISEPAARKRISRALCRLRSTIRLEDVE